VLDEAAEALESLDWACAELRRRIWGSEVESAVGTLAVVVLEVLANEVARWRSFRIRIQSRHSRRIVRTNRSA
jgi:hypothetical protein